MENVEQLIAKAAQVRSATLAYPEFRNAEKYVKEFNSWLQNRPATGVGVIWCNAIFECSVISEASLFLAIHGFYEEACATLRGLLDGFLARLYWDIRNNNGELKERTENGRWTNDYCQWEMGTASNYPRLKDDIWPTLLNEQRIAEYDRQHHIKREASSRLQALDRFVHGRPISRHYDGAFRGSTMNIDFKPRHFDEWYENLRGVYGLVFTLSLLQYPCLLETVIWNESRTLEPDNASKLIVLFGS